MVLVALVATQAAAQTKEALAERFAKGMEAFHRDSDWTSPQPKIMIAPDDSFFEESSDDIGDEVVVRFRRGTWRFRIAEYKDRWVRAETDHQLGIPTKPFPAKPMLPRWGQPLRDDASLRSGDEDAFFSVILATGQSNTGLRYLQIPGVENETAQFGRFALVWRPGGKKKHKR